jgi:DNA-binding CsgD family transcriptional regulator
MNPKIGSFFFHTVFGNVIGSVIEVFFPLLALFISSKVSLRLPFREKNDPYDFFEIVLTWTFSCMFVVINYATMQVLFTFNKDPQNFSSDLKFAWVASFGILGGVILLLKIMKKWYDSLKERYEKEKQKREEEQRRFEIELRQTQEKIDSLTKHHEELKDLKVDQEQIDFVWNAIEQLKAYHRQLVAKKKYGFIFEKIINDKIEFDEIQTQIIELIVEGKSNREIAQIICLSEGRTANRITEILAKGGFKDRAALVAYYIIRDTFTDK